MSISTVAEAQPSERFPDHVTVFVEGERHEAFNLGGFRELLRIDADLMYVEDQLDLREAQVESLEAATAQLSIAWEACSDSLAIARAEIDRLVDMWARENRLRHEAENSLSRKGLAAWVLAAGLFVATLVAGGIAIGLSRD